MESDLPVPMTRDPDVTNSTAYTFSDKLMMYYTTSSIALSVGFYGASVSQSPRIDLGIMYNRLSAEIQKISEDGDNIMIRNKRLEQHSIATERKYLGIE